MSQELELRGCSLLKELDEESLATLAESLERVPMIEGGKQVQMDRYSEVEVIEVDGLKPMEAFTDGYPSSLLKLCVEKGVKTFRGKTIRYGGFVEKIKLLDDLGLISEKPVEYEG